MSKRRLLVMLGVSAALVFGLYLASDVDSRLTEADRTAILGLGLDPVCLRLATFEDELVCIRALQARLQVAAPELECVHTWGAVSHEPDAFLARGRGCCYDRSRLIEKALSYYGLETRHLSIHRLRWPPPFGYLQSVPSHATSEARTRRGWMVVDSNRPTLGLDREGRPYDARALREALREGRAGELEGRFGDYFEGDYTIFYGLYSRHGGFYPPMLPVPDVDWAELRHNF